jgi:hypothetical protein
MVCWLQSSFLRNIRTGVRQAISPIPGFILSHVSSHVCLFAISLRDCPRIYYVMTVRGKADRGSIGSTTNVASVVRTTPGSSRPTR